jgi:hypothetical protein
MLQINQGKCNGALYNWQRKNYNLHLQSHHPNETAALGTSATANLVDNITHAKRKAFADEVSATAGQPKQSSNGCLELS